MKKWLSKIPEVVIHITIFMKKWLSKIPEVVIQNTLNWFSDIHMHTTIHDSEQYHLMSNKSNCNEHIKFTSASAQSDDIFCNGPAEPKILTHAEKIVNISRTTWSSHIQVYIF